MLFVRAYSEAIEFVDQDCEVGRFREKMDGKNEKPGWRGAPKFGGSNEKPRRARGSGGAQSETVPMGWESELNDEGS